MFAVVGTTSGPLPFDYAERWFRIRRLIVVPALKRRAIIKERPIRK
jgi:hypothetical protein